MLPRLTFLAITIFWVTMNVLLWKSQYGQQGGEIPVPLELVWLKILSAPDPSSLSVYQKGERTGYCEISTSVQQAMARLDGDKPPPEAVLNQAGCLLHINGNLSFGDFTNRLKFDARITFNTRRQCREFYVRLILHGTSTEIHCLTTNQSVSVSYTAPDVTIQRQFHFADLQNPQALWRTFAGEVDSPWLGFLELPALNPANSASLPLAAKRTRLKLGTEQVTVYRVETTVLGQTITLDVSTIGEILRVQLPNGLTATIDPS